MYKAPEICHLVFGATFILYSATFVMSLGDPLTTVASAELLRRFPRERVQKTEETIKTLSDDGNEHQSIGEKIKKIKRQEKPPLVLKLLKEKLDQDPISNHLTAHPLPRPVPFTVPQEQVYAHLHSHAAQEQHEHLFPSAELEEFKEPPPKYQYIYKVKDPEGNDFGHTEARVGDRTWGRYFVQQPDGQEKTVRYWADHSGFHAEVEYRDMSLGHIEHQ